MEVERESCKGTTNSEPIEIKMLVEEANRNIADILMSTGLRFRKIFAKKQM